MGRTEQQPGTNAAPPQPPSDQCVEGYEPPDVAWEEEFQPLAADSICLKDPGAPGCPGT